MNKLLIIVLSFSALLLKAQDEKEDSPNSRAEYEYRKIAPPNGEKIPFGELNKANAKIDEYFKNIKGGKLKNAVPNIAWKERGPSNIGGRVRAIMFDPNNSNKVWAGSVAGGLWYNNDITNVSSVWGRISDFWENLAISSIAYDPSNTQRFYVATGEGFGNYDAVAGGGIWRTSDGGTSWSRLPNTIPNHNVDDSTLVLLNFRTIQKIVVTTTGRIFVGGQVGVATSTDNGDSWKMVQNLPTGYFVDDLELGGNNTVYVTMRRWDNTLKRNIRRIYRSINYSVWTDITPSDASNRGGRTEIAISQSNVSTIYAICQNDTLSSGKANGVLWFKKSTDNGQIWNDISIPTFGGNPNLHFTNNQAWYDLILAIHPTNPNLVIAGGVVLARTTDGGSSWYVYEGGNQQVHSDQHGLLFKPDDSNVILNSNDGGIYYSINAGDANIASNAVVFSNRNTGLRITQPYHVAMKNIAGDNYLLMGTQDNGTLSTNGANLDVGTQELGADGWRCFIDANEPNIRVLSTQYVSHYFHDGTNPPIQIINGATSPFYNPCDYDDINNVFYAYRDTVRVSGSTLTRFFRVVDMAGTRTVNTFSINIIIPVSFIKVGRSASTIFVGCDNGAVYKITNMDTNPTVTQLRSVSGNYVSSIDVGATDSELLVVESNYNIHSVWHTINNGANWIDKDDTLHGLPDFPIRYGIFNPTNRNQVLLATESGVWSTINFNAANPNWQPTDQFLAHVRCDMIFYRSADNMIAVATHGRGAFTAILNLCPTDLVYGADSNGSKHYEASNSITSSADLNVGSKINYDAGYKVRLTSGFKVPAGTHFKAYIDGCGGNR